MDKIASLLVMTAVAFVFNAPVLASEFSVGTIIVQNPWSRATPVGAKVGAGYMNIANASNRTDRLVSLTSPVSERVEIHTTALSDGILRMRKLGKGLVIEANGVVQLKPGGFHLMFIGLKKPLVQDQSFKVTLTFAEAGAVEIPFLIGAMGGKSPYADDTSSHGGSRSGTGNAQGSHSN